LIHRTFRVRSAQSFPGGLFTIYSHCFKAWWSLFNQNTKILRYLSTKKSAAEHSAFLPVSRICRSCRRSSQSRNERPALTIFFAWFRVFCREPSKDAIESGTFLKVIDLFFDHYRWF
jgi:hypothetical protein